MNKKILNTLLLVIFVSSVMLSGCKKDEEEDIKNPPSPGVTATFTDSRDSKEYKYVVIGNQKWMVENLAYTGSDIKHITDDIDWYDNASVDAWSYYDHDASNVDKYGVLYQWEAAKIACPDGWHLPTDADWLELENYLKENGYSYDGVGNDKIAKSLATNSGWDASNFSGAVGNSDYTDYMNITGFSATPSGLRGFMGEFDEQGKAAYYWSATEDSGTTAGNRNMKYDSRKLYTNHDNKRFGFSVRCVKD